MNNKIALLLTKTVGTMWAAYAFAVLAIIGFPGLFSDVVNRYVSWISQTFIQLTMLSVIMVGQTLLSDKHDEHADSLNDLHDKIDAISTDEDPKIT